MATSLKSELANLKISEVQVDGINVTRGLTEILRGWVTVYSTFATKKDFFPIKIIKRFSI